MSQLLKTADWAESLFSGAELGDKRRTKRLIAVGEQFAEHIGDSIVASCKGNEAKLEGVYRFIRNDNIDPQAIAESGFAAVASQAKQHKTLLALEDSTTLGYSHSLSHLLGDLGGSQGSKRQGYWVHNVLLMDAQQEQTVGLVEQSYWLREPGSRGKANQRTSRAYQDKESFKWETASERVSSRLGEKMADVISVCDREADIYEYLFYKQRCEQRFVVRASWDRNLADDEGHLFDKVQDAVQLGQYQIRIPQKGGRPGRDATLELRAVSVEIKPPSRLPKTWGTLTVNLVIAEEVGGPGEEPLRWLLLTTETVKNFNQARQITRYYELRWRVEDFHKAWKSGGTGVEALRLQAPDNLRRAAIILAFVAIRLIQLRECFINAREGSSDSVLCDALLDKHEWQALWITREKKPLPGKVPSAAWAYDAIARLGGWVDSKRTGRVSWSTLWKGWFRLQDKVDGLRAALEIMQTSD